MTFFFSLERILGPKGINGFFGESTRDEGTVQTNRVELSTQTNL
jgi:hypothetical protein